jgi:D-alanyl-D-alanine carboxypeptidase
MDRQVQRGTLHAEAVITRASKPCLRSPDRRSIVGNMKWLSAGVAVAAVPLMAVGLQGCGDNTNGNVDIRNALDNLTAMDVPGAIALVNRGGDVTTIASGSSSTAVFSPMTSAATTRIASVSKAFNGATVLALVNEGRLSLTSSIGELLPELPPQWHPVTVAQLLQHTSGLPDYIKNEQFLEEFIADPLMQRSPLELLVYVADDPVEFAAGSEYAYSDTDNIVAGLIVEKVAESTYLEQMSQLVLDPLSLQATTLPDTPDISTPAILGYALDEPEQKDAGSEASPSPSPGAAPEFIDVSELINPSLAWASGGMVSTAANLDRFIRWYAPGTDLSPELRDAQRQFVPGESGPPGPGANASGLALYQYSTTCGEVYGHTGNMPGYTVFTAATPDGTTSAVLIANRQVNPTGDPAAYEAFVSAADTIMCAGR